MFSVWSTDDESRAKRHSLWEHSSHLMVKPTGRVGFGIITRKLSSETALESFWLHGAREHIICIQYWIFV